MRAITKKIVGLLLSATTLFSSAFFAGCDFLSSLISPPPTNENEITDSMFLKAEGELVKNADGKTVYLRGVNAGGLFVIEQWMNGFARSTGEGSSITARDHRTTTQVFIERFGKERTRELWKTYRENWWSKIDFVNCVDMGINVIRLPFTYMNVDFDATTSLDNGGKNYDFSEITAFVNEAAKYGIYTILDLHGAYGSQNGQDHSGETLSQSQVDFYSNEKKQKLTIDLWMALAEHFKDNPAVAGYDILNEPAEKLDAGGTQTTTTRHWEFFDKVYDAIRAVDENHMVIFESCWDAENLPHPSRYGWENCMYSIHHYSNCTGQDRTEEHNRSMDYKISSVREANFGVPIQMGEFTCYDNVAQWEYTLNALNEAGWHWCSWTYKINASNLSPWGVVGIRTSNQNKVNAHTDSYETIVEKFKKLKTDENIKYYEFSNEERLFNVIRKYAMAE